MSIKNTVNSQLEQAKNTQVKIQSVVNEQFEKASGEVRKILKEMGATVVAGERLNVSNAFTEIKNNTDSVRQLVNNLDVATYDLRNRFAWNAHMLSAFAELKAVRAIEKAIEDSKPKINAYRNQVETTVAPYKEKAEAQISQLATQASSIKDQVETTVAPYKEKAEAQISQLATQASSIKDQVNSKLGR